MFTQSKYRFLSKRSIRVALGFVVVALVAGIYFLFRPFPAGPSLDVAAKAPGVKEAASVNGWSAYANPPAEVKANDSRSLSAAAYNQKLFPGQASVKGFLLGGGLVSPNTSSASSSVQKLDIVGGTVLETNLFSGRLISPSAPSSSVAVASVQRLDIGAGYVLETSSKGSKIVAPSAPSNPASAALAAQESRLPSFVRQIVGSDYERDFAPASVAEPASAQEPGLVPSFVLAIRSQDERGFAPAVSASATQRLYIGAGYVLETSSKGSKIVAPSASFVPAPAVAASATQTLYIGAGYVLETNAQGSRIVAPNTPLKLAATVSNADYLKKIDIGSGYTLLLGPGDSWKIAPAP